MLLVLPDDRQAEILTDVEKGDLVRLLVPHLIDTRRVEAGTVLP